MGLSPRLLRRPSAPTPPPPVGTANMLLHFDGDFSDASPYGVTVTPQNGAETTTDAAVFGGGSLRLPATSPFTGVSLPASVSVAGTEDFTIEGWVQLLAATPGSGYAMLLGYAGAGNFMFGFIAGGYVWAGQSWVNIPHVSPGVLPVDEWAHVALCRKSGSLRIFVDGINVYEAADAYSYAGTAGQIGNDSGGNSPVNAYVDEFRVTRGLSVYGGGEYGDFVVPSSPLSAFSAESTEFLPYGTLISQACDGVDLVGTYADGTGGRYTEVISEGTCA